MLKAGLEMTLSDIGADLLLSLCLLAGSVSFGYFFLRTGWHKVRILDSTYKLGWATVIGISFSIVIILVSFVFGLIPFMFFGFREFLFLTIIALLPVAIVVLTIRRKFFAKKTVSVAIPKKIVGARIASEKAILKLDLERGYVKVKELDKDRVKKIKEMLVKRKEKEEVEKKKKAAPPKKTLKPLSKEDIILRKKGKWRYREGLFTKKPSSLIVEKISEPKKTPKEEKIESLRKIISKAKKGEKVAPPEKPKERKPEAGKPAAGFLEGIRSIFSKKPEAKKVEEKPKVKGLKGLREIVTKKVEVAKKEEKVAVEKPAMKGLKGLRELVTKKAEAEGEIEKPVEKGLVGLKGIVTKEVEGVDAKIEKIKKEEEEKPVKDEGIETLTRLLVEKEEKIRIIRKKKAKQVKEEAKKSGK